MNPKTEALKARTKKFAHDVLDFVDTLPGHGPSVRIGNQLGDAGTSVGANYTAACRARSKAEFAAKIGLVLEEADESLLQEADELTAIFAASSITTRESLSANHR